AAVRHRRVRGEAAVSAMIAFVRRGDFGHSLPQCLTGLLVQAHHDELLLFVGAGSSAGAATTLPTASARIRGARIQGASIQGGTILCVLCLVWRRGLSDLACRHGRGQKDSITPDYRSRKASTRNRDLPFDVFRVAEFNRRGGARHSIEERPAPLRPVGGIRTGGT